MDSEPGTYDSMEFCSLLFDRRPSSDDRSEDGNSTDTTVAMENDPSDSEPSVESGNDTPDNEEDVVPEANVQDGVPDAKPFKPFTKKLFNNLCADTALVEAMNAKPTGGTKDMPRCNAVCLDSPEPKYRRFFSAYTGPAIVYATDEELNAKTKDVGVQTVPIGEPITHSNNPWADEFSRYRLRQPGQKDEDRPWTYPKVPPKRKAKVRKI